MVTPSEEQNTFDDIGYLAQEMLRLVIEWEGRNRPMTSEEFRDCWSYKDGTVTLTFPAWQS